VTSAPAPPSLPTDTASAGTATAFYFASKASEQTQRDLLDAAFIRIITTALRLKLETEPAGAAEDLR
jgi:hypothetical protein